jgi:hypothetical protein
MEFEWALHLNPNIEKRVEGDFTLRKDIVE